MNISLLCRDADTVLLENKYKSKVYLANSKINWQYTICTFITQAVQLLSHIKNNRQKLVSISRVNLFLLHWKMRQKSIFCIVSNLNLSVLDNLRFPLLSSSFLKDFPVPSELKVFSIFVFLRKNSHKIKIALIWNLKVRMICTFLFRLKIL